MSMATKNDDSAVGDAEPINEPVDVAEAVVIALEDAETDTGIDAEVPSSRELVFAKAKELDIDALTEEDLDSWISALSEELKVGLIIDGQHRVLGTKHKNIPFLIAALPDAGWQELAFQFIVLNSTARTVKEALLINIIGTSLTSDELTKVEKRLVDSGIPVPLYQGVMRLHDDSESPFYGMLRFGMAEVAPIDAKAAKSKIASFWHRASLIYPMVAHNIPGKTKREKLENWVALGLWYDYLKVFWGVAKKRYADTDLWSSQMLPDNSAPVSKLLRATILNLVQIGVCQVMLEAIYTEVNNDPDGAKTVATILPDISAFRKRCEMYFNRLKPEFFSEWGPGSKGLDGSRGPRDEFVKAVKQIITNEKTVADLKNQSTGSIIFKL
ncbi:MAG TPA: hypothetical protein VF169_03915 [Albitalea sp.]|uniref:hypothetical protein n=1 Tax=Piscinibacter sp. TaxID=1903157 RepID=UPI002ED0685D